MRKVLPLQAVVDCSRRLRDLGRRLPSSTSVRLEPIEEQVGYRKGIKGLMVLFLNELN